MYVDICIVTAAIAGHMCSGLTLGRSMCSCKDQAGPQSASSQSWSCAQQAWRGGICPVYLHLTSASLTMHVLRQNRKGLAIDAES